MAQTAKVCCIHCRISVRSVPLLRRFKSAVEFGLGRAVCWSMWCCLLSVPPWVWGCLSARMIGFSGRFRLDVFGGTVLPVFCKSAFAVCTSRMDSVAISVDSCLLVFEACRFSRRLSPRLQQRHDRSGPEESALCCGST